MATPPSLPRRLARGLGFVLFCVVAGALIAEGVVRLAAPPPVPKECLRHGSNLYPSNPRGTFFREGACWTIARDERLAACDAPVDPAVPQVLVLGDSFTEGQGVSTRDTWPMRLTFPGAFRRVCAKGGDNLDEVVARFDAARARFRPALAIYAMVLNDLGGFEAVNDYINVRLGELEDRIDAGEAEAQLGPFAFLARWSLLVRKAVRARALAEVGVRTEATYHRMFEPSVSLDRAFDRIAAMARASDRFLLVLFPLFERLDAYPFEDVHASVRREAERRGILFLDLLDTFRGRDTEALVVYPEDRHPNEVAQQLAADAIRERLKSLGWLDLRAVPGGGG